MQSVPITTNVVSSNLDLGEVYNIISSINKTDRHYITEILLKVALNTIKQTTKTLCNIRITLPTLNINFLKFVKSWISNLDDQNFDKTWLLANIG
jgi:hypothetical protein